MRLRTVLICLAVCSPGLAEEGTHHRNIGQLGTVRFQISCSPKVQAPFSRAAAMLHSFWYNEAEKAFSYVAEADSACGMAYWGVAMSNYHPVWAPPNPAELKRGVEAAQKAVAIGAKTVRERDYIAAIAAFYRGSDRLDHRGRAVAYEKAMEQLYRKYPDDSEAGIFYALALLGTAPPTDKQYVNQRKAAGILNRLLPKNPNHPGAAHYMIHSYDYPQLAELALPAARSYAKIAPDSPHALHMPSHIFTRLGLWEDSIQSNIASAASARKHVQRLKPGAGSFDQVHAMASGYDWATQVEVQRRAVAAWLAHAEGRAEEAIQLMGSAADLEDSTDKHPVTPGAALPARELLGDMLLELKRPAEALKEFESVLKQSPNRFNGLYGAARAAKLSDDPTKAKAYFAKLTTLGAKADTVRPELEEARQQASATLR